MASDAAKLLDELMGRDRNLAPTEKEKSKPNFDDPDVCKFFLCGFCPHELFVNTRADLGTCDKFHDEDLRRKYDKSSKNGRLGYEEDFLAFLQSLLSDVEKRIQKGKTRLALNNSQAAMSGPQVQKEEKVEMLSQRINDLVEQAEELGCEGKVEEAQGVLKLCEQLKEEREQLQNVSNFHQTLQPKEMEVCEVCGAFLVMGDAQQRVEEHLMGKQHLGYGKVRDTIDKLRRKIRGEPTPEEVEKRNKERAERDKEREKEREEREKEREKRQKEREEREKEREKEREERRKKRSRSRSRSRRHRSRSRDRRRRSRSRDRRRSSRERSKRSHRSRSRDRRRSRDRSSRSSRDKDRSRSEKSRGKSRERSESRKSKDKEDKAKKENGDEVKVKDKKEENETKPAVENQSGAEKAPENDGNEAKMAGGDGESTEVKTEEMAEQAPADQSHGDTKVDENSAAPGKVVDNEEESTCDSTTEGGDVEMKETSDVTA